MKIGFGYDSHRFEPGPGLVLGGVHVDHGRSLAGHSDADAVLHAVTDALLGAIGGGDIGELFADDDPQWADADSSVFVVKVMEMVTSSGLRVENCDITIIAEEPKLSKYKKPMCLRIAELLGVDAAAVNVKAKTNEKMGFAGRGEGLVVMAAVLVSEQ
ncbi:MAG TPA: 2-C-methyl-D-erythritol 2,4-cyclodiphosphate synthase [Phycisphaerae bacterium]|nr:2-C-methyl-D-erythritol 2,4-cyclodiphosphate synthase [Phycisphaerae bacterium]